MKKIKSIALIMLVIVVAGCSKKSNTTPAFTVGMSFKFNGTVKTPSLVVADFIKSQNSLQISGTNATEGLTIFLENVKVGTFDLVADNVLASYAPDTNFNDAYIGSTGTVVITSFTSTTVTGTFQFAASTIGAVNGTITEGKFSAKLITQ